MTLTANEHQKIAILQQVANLVGQAQSVAGNQTVLNNIINNILPQISRFERSDPEFAELAIQMRRARTGQSPHYLTNIAGQAQRMISLVRGGLGYKVNREGEKVIWDPVRGMVTSPMFEEGEPIRTFSPMGWRGSKKYPFGRAFPEKNLIEGWDTGFGSFFSKSKGALVGVGVGTICGIVAEKLLEGKFKDKVPNPTVQKLLAYAVGSVAAIVSYGMVS